MSPGPGDGTRGRACHVAWPLDFHDGLKSDAASTIGALCVAAPFGLVLACADRRRRFDWEDRIGWSLVPFARFLAFRMNAARHLMIVLLVPDKRGIRSAVAAVALAVPVLLPGVALQCERADHHAPAGRGPRGTPSADRLEDDSRRSGAAPRHAPVDVPADLIGAFCPHETCASVARRTIPSSSPRTRIIFQKCEEP